VELSLKAVSVVIPAHNAAATIAATLASLRSEADLIGEVLVVTIYILDKTGIIGFGFLWLNMVGALTVVILSWLMNNFSKTNTAKI